MKTIILGAGGQLGTELMRQLPQAIGLCHQEFDISLAVHYEQLKAHHPECIINCAAYNQVDRAEADTILAWQGNVLGPRHLAQFCQTTNCQLIHISTDFVFGNDSVRSTPWRETDLPGPVSIYGITKLSGEHLVQAICPDALIIRTCGLYGHGGNNFVKTMLRLATQGRSLKVVDDQICAPTSITDLAEAILHLADKQARGLYHFVNQGQLSWYEFARLIFQKSGLSADLSPTTSAAYGAPAARPAYSVLNCEKYIDLTGQSIRSIEAALDIYLNQSSGSFPK